VRRDKKADTRERKSDAEVDPGAARARLHPPDPPDRRRGKDEHRDVERIEDPQRLGRHRPDPGVDLEEHDEPGAKLQARQAKNEGGDAEEQERCRRQRADPSCYSANARR
jgi:hypothetical protein